MNVRGHDGFAILEGPLSLEDDDYTFNVEFEQPTWFMRLSFGMGMVSGLLWCGVYIAIPAAILFALYKAVMWGAAL